PEGAAASMLSAVRHAMRRRRAGRRRDDVGKSGWASGGRGVATVAWVKGFIDGLQYRETQIGTTPAIIPQSATRRYCFATPLSMRSSTTFLPTCGWSACPQPA